MEIKATETTYWKIFTGDKYVYGSTISGQTTTSTYDIEIITEDEYREHTSEFELIDYAIIEEL